MKIALGSDHGGYDAKKFIKEFLQKQNIYVNDFGCFDKQSVDYPDYAQKVALEVSHSNVDCGILVCTTGIGMSIMANKFPYVRAALCSSASTAEMARAHNNANILVLAGGILSKDNIESILNEWLKVPFSYSERHKRRLNKIKTYSTQEMEIAGIYEEDPEIYSAIRKEMCKQEKIINLIASENYVSLAVREAQGSVMTNKYAEGYPAKRWYNGCEHVDTVECLAIERAKKLFGCEYVNVQPHCGSAANMAVYFSVLEPGDTILAMSLAHGGHLTHGNSINFSGRLFNIVGYGVSEDTEQIDYEAVSKLAIENKPKLIIVGASSYPRILDFEKFREIADSVGAYLMVDMAHIAGLVAAGVHPDPVPFSEFITTTTHKTLRGPRGGMVLCKEPFGANLDKQVFPGIQGGPLMHSIAAKAVCFFEAMKPEFTEYATQLVHNAKVMAEILQKEGLRLVSGGTDNHLMLIDLSNINITGKDAAKALDTAGIIVNKNAIPFDKRSPFVTSGIRIGTPAITTRGMKDSEMKFIAEMIVRVLRNINDVIILKKVRKEVETLTSHFSVP